MARSKRSSKSQKSKKQVDYIDDWDEYFLSLAEAAAKKSKDPRCQVGAVIVSANKIVVSTGFNGLARGVYDNDEILSDVDEKLKWICHAEENAIFNAARLGVSLVGCTIYVNKFPCFSCCNAIAQAGIKRVCTQDDSYWDEDPMDADHSRKPVLLKQAGVEVHAPLHPRFVPLRRFARTGSANGKQPSRVGSNGNARHAAQLEFPQVSAVPDAAKPRLAKSRGRRIVLHPSRRAS